VSYTCPNGHSSGSEDYCDVCGAPIALLTPAAAGTSPPSGAAQSAVAAPSGQPVAATAGSVLDPAAAPTPERRCLHCGAANDASALFCEDCGYDFTTGQLPPQIPPASVPPLNVPPPNVRSEADWVAEVWVDPDWYDAQEAEEPCPSAGMPVVVPLTGTSLLVGRRSASRNIRPHVDVRADAGVSHRHIQLTTDGQRWWVEDLQSTNGTYIGSASADLPNAPITPGQRVELADDDRIYLGAWTRLVVRRAMPEERTGSAS
jgi:hypothetical protein